MMAADVSRQVAKAVLAGVSVAFPVVFVADIDADEPGACFHPTGRSLSRKLVLVARALSTAGDDNDDVGDVVAVVAVVVDELLFLVTKYATPAITTMTMRTIRTIRVRRWAGFLDGAPCPADGPPAALAAALAILRSLRSDLGPLSPSTPAWFPGESSGSPRRRLPVTGSICSSALGGVTMAAAAPAGADRARGVAGATGVGATGVGATGVGATGVGATGVGATGVGATGVGATGVGATGVGATGVGATGVGATGVGATGV